MEVATSYSAIKCVKLSNSWICYSGKSFETVSKSGKFGSDQLGSDFVFVVKGN